MAIPPDPKNAKPAAAPTSTGKKTLTYSIAPGSKPAAAPTAGAQGGGGLADIASALAAQGTQAAIAGYRALQDYANQQGMLRAAQQGQLGIAASKYLEGLDLPGRTTSDYAAAAAAQREAASGYSGGLQQTVSDAAAEVQRNLAAGGSPQTAYNQGEAAGNALYALGGALPATQFGVTGPTVAAGLRALPAQTLGYAQQLALGQLGAGQQEAAKYNADIVGALAKQGTLAASYLDTLSAAQQKAIADAETAQYHADTLTQRGQIANQTAGIKQQQLESLNAWRTTQSKIAVFKAQAQSDYQNARLTNDAARIAETSKHNQAIEKLSAENAANLNAFRNGQLDLGTFNANTSRINSETSRINARTSRMNALKPPAPSNAAGTAPSVIDTGKSGLNHYYTNQYGQPTDQYGTPLKTGQRFVPTPDYTIKNGRIVKRTGPAKPSKPLTPAARHTETSRLRTGIQRMKDGWKEGDNDPNPGKPHPALSREQALAELQLEGYFTSPQYARLANDMLNSIYGKVATAKSSGPFGVTAQATP